MFISIRIDPSYLGEASNTNALTYRRTPYCTDCAMARMTVDLFRMFDPVDQDEADQLQPIAQAYVEATLQQTHVAPGTRCRRCRADLTADPRSN
jgi:hypothetical protein